MDRGNFTDESPAHRHIKLLLREGRFREARSLLAQGSDAFACIERARLSFFLDNDLKASHELALRAVDVAETNGQRLLARALASCALVSAGRTTEAFEVGDLVNIEPSMISEVIYYVAFAAYLGGNVAAAETWLNSHSPTAAAMRARYLLVRGVFAAAKEQFADQARFAAEALSLLETEAPEEAYLIANAAHVLAVLAREIPVVDAATQLEGVYSKLRNDDGFTGSRFHMLRALGWSRALAGDFGGSLRYIVRAASDASTNIQRLYAHLDHASVAIFAGEQTSASARAAFGVAMDYAAAIPWETLIDDSLSALPLAAELAAELGETELAQRYCELALRLRDNVAKRFTMAHDSRLSALVSGACALAYAGTDRDRAIEDAVAAFVVFDRYGFAWRAARMALLLWKLTRRAIWRERAQQHLAAYPQSPFARVLEAGVQRTVTPQQGKVLELLLRGHDNERIGHELGISANTVRIHVGKLFRLFGVKSRVQLIAKAQSRLQQAARA